MLQRYAKIISFLLLLVFTQKMGLRLWLHDWFHENTHSSSKAPAAGKVQLRCDCIDDALMPLTVTAQVVLQAPDQKGVLLLAAYFPPFSAAETVFYSLKGPPALLLSSFAC
jgi:hypothetical protein